ncbi:bis(5'-nucleosyl)-tetraphosphatase (symmetrical) YqeK [Mesoaciditoga lauensis]|uniref:bis(5'-nucleosyl)-tetraphosphatase (symmetrical) YqeK n=1 Tax=Mesoaciditoga lauensis TaxID=1495039 RepID=UPI00068F9670|nr:bis(5'-nucleosyl)-tetraphosphatase (symmetrical) YqeK [Mesoaciditoga lauensis]
MNTPYKQVIELLEKYREFMVSRQRAAHIQRMEEDGIELSQIHHLDSEKLLIAVCAHDLFRDTRPDVLLKMAKVWNIPLTDEERAFPLLLHGKIAGEFLKRRFGIRDEEIITAVAHHTSGVPTESKIVKALVILDTIEHGRAFPGVDELRKTAKESLDECYEKVIKNKIEYALDNDLLVLIKSVETWNYLKLKGVHDEVF